MLVALGLLFVTGLFLYNTLKSYLTRNAQVWSKQNVTSLKNDLTFLDIAIGRKTGVDFDIQYYKDLGDEGFGGSVEVGIPLLYVKDLDLAKNVLVKDFDHFVDRRDFVQTDPLMSKSLFFLRSQQWKDMRSFLSPTFTSGKIRRMFPYFQQSSNKLLTYMSKFNTMTDGGYNVIFPEIANRFTLDVIGATAFGMEVDCLTKADSLFYHMARRTNDFNLKRIIRFGVLSNFVKLASFLNLYFLEVDVTKFYVNMLTHAYRARMESTEQREDFLQLLKEAGEVDPSDDTVSNDGKKQKMPLSESVAIQQAFLFFLAGFDTVASTIGETCYLLAAHPDIQEKVFAEVEEVLQSSDGKITYEAFNKLEYLDMTISEVLRLYPVVTRIERKCTKPYKIPGTKVVIPKETLVAVPAESIHRDEKYYPDPLTFNPERFSPENKANRNPYAYMPFGIGPRNCIGMRFALIEVKVAVALLLHNFKILPTEKTPIPVKMQKDLGFYRAPQDLELRLVPRT